MARRTTMIRTGKRRHLDSLLAEILFGLDVHQEIVLAFQDVVFGTVE
jgi:hypothetical protein